MNADSQMLDSPFPGPVLITGCSTGVGHAAALASRAAGFETFAMARDPAPLDDLRRAGCHTLQLDVTDEDARQAVIGTILAQFGAVGVLLNNAGYGQHGPVEEVTLGCGFSSKPTCSADCGSSSLCCPPCGTGGSSHHQCQLGRGTHHILGGGAYHASKFAIEALANSLRPEVEGFGIDVINALPGPIATQFETTLIESIPDTGEQSPYF